MDWVGGSWVGGLGKCAHVHGAEPVVKGRHLCTEVVELGLQRLEDLQTELRHDSANSRRPPLEDAYAWHCINARRYVRRHTTRVVQPKLDIKA